jgi:hypothetical protein
MVVTAKNDRAATAKIIFVMVFSDKPTTNGPF